MKKQFLFTCLLIFSFLLIFSSFSGGEYSGLAGKGQQNRTGSPTHSGYLPENDCSTGSGCHDVSTTPFALNFSLIDVSVTPNVLSLGTYIPNKKYLVKINGAFPSEPTPALPSFGFQCSVVGWLADSGRFHGAPPAVKRGLSAKYSWNPFTKNTPARVDTFLAGGAYCIENTATLTNHGGSIVSSSWEADFFWQAPDSSMADTVGFWYILCAVDGDSTSANDITLLGPKDGVLFTWRPLVGINKIFNDVNFTVYPNPVKEQLYIRMSSLQTGTYGVTVFDMSGRKIYTQKLDVTGSSYTASINTANWPNGIYQVQFTKDGSQHTVSVVKQ